MQRSPERVLALFLFEFYLGAARRYALARADVHARAAVILMGSPTEEWGEDRNMMFAQTVR